MATDLLDEADLTDRLSRSVKRAREMFLGNYGNLVADDVESQRLRLTSKILDEFEHVRVLPEALRPKLSAAAAASGALYSGSAAASSSDATDASISSVLERLPVNQQSTSTSMALVPSGASSSSALMAYGGSASSQVVARLGHQHNVPKPKWHAPWKLMRVISGHLGWVRCIAVDPTNEWFATGSADRTIKIWDLASGTLKLSLTGHISTVRGLAVSDRHPYLYSVGEDKQAKCWDLEVNKVVRHYHGHLNGIYACALHPTLDILVTAGRDAAVCVWDIRSKNIIYKLTGHTNTVASVVTQASDPQIISGSMDQSVRLWDLAAGKCRAVLTNHKKSVRSVILHPSEFTFASASPDNIKQWRCPDGDFLQNLAGHNSIVNCMALNQDNVLFSGADNGTMYFWDWKSGYNFQQAKTLPQPGSLESESGIYAASFDRSGARLITCEADKSIKVWREDENATEETNPISFKASLKKTRY